MLMMVEKGIRSRICQAVYRHAKAKNKYINNCNKDNESSYLEYLDLSNLYGWAMSQKLPVNGFEWVEEDDLLKFKESFIKNYAENCDKGYILEVDVKYPKNLHNLQRKFKNVTSLFVPYKTKKTVLFT